MKFPPLARYRTPQDLARRLADLSPADAEPIPLAEGEPFEPRALRESRDFGATAGFSCANRFCIHPMEGWDGMRDGTPSEWTIRRWRNFGLSGASLIWGGEAVAVVPEGRANPNQLYCRPENESGLALLARTAREARREFVARAEGDGTGAAGGGDAFALGLQLTHSGRFCRPDAHDRLSARTAQAHPVLDARAGIDPTRAILSDGELDDLAGAFTRVAVAARELGFDFVDVKHCHGYLLHELLGAKLREGRYGGSFENRTRFLREVVAGIRRDAPGLGIGVRLSLFDDAPPPPPDTDAPPGYDPANHHFGACPTSLPTSAGDAFPEPDLSETVRFVELCRELGVFMVNATAGSPYYSSYMQRPAAYPPVDGKPVDVDPLLGVVRQIRATRAIRRAVPEVPVVGSALTYLQEHLPRVAEGIVGAGWADFAGIGRMVLSYPEFPADVLAGRPPVRNRVCRTFSDCTNGPRMGFVSGCFPLDPAYRAMPEWEMIRERKKANPV